MSYNDFFSRHRGEGSYSFFIPLNQKNLEDIVKEMPLEIKKEMRQIDTVGILPNSRFTAKIDFAEPSKFKSNKIVEGKLRYLNAEPIEIAPSLYLVFRLIKTNSIDNNWSRDYYEYKIMHLHGIGSALLGEGRSIIDKHEIKLSEIDQVTIGDNFGNSNPCDDEDEVEVIRSVYAQSKFKISIKFE